MTPPDVERTYPLRRVVSPDVRSALERFSDPQLLASGQVNLIGLDAIAARVGERWPARAASVREQLMRILERHLSREDFYDLVSDKDVVIVQPNAGRYAAQATCLRCLRELLTFFLGDDREAAGGVFAVQRISGDVLDVAVIDAVEIDRLAVPEAAARASGPGTSLPAVGRTPFRSSLGKPLDMTCTLDPVYELKACRRIGQRLTRSVWEHETRRRLTYAELMRLSRKDLLHIDLAAVTRGIEGLSHTDDGDLPPSLIVPISFPTLNATEGRLAVLEALGQAARRVSRGVICEITPIDDVPISALADAVGFIRPHVLFVVGRWYAPEQRRDSLRQAGLHGVCLRGPPLADDTAFDLWRQAALGNARRVTRSVLVYGVDGPDQAARAGAAGATHVSLAPR